MALLEWDAARYQLLRVLMPKLSGGGQLGLYLDTWLGVEVAAKRFPWKRVRQSPGAYRRAHPAALEDPWKEFALAQRLGASSPGACACYGAFRDVQGDVLLVMEYVPAGDLFDWAGGLGDPGPERERLVWPVLQSLLQAVSALHAMGVAHGDVSLENALLRAGAQVVLVDFEAARVGSELENASGSRGRPSYQAPEMHTSARYDARTADLFSCGVAAYGLAIGDYPWDSTRPGACTKFAFAQKHGLDAFLAKRCVMTSRGQTACVGECMSPELKRLLCALLHPVPDKRHFAKSALKEEAADKGVYPVDAFLGA